MKRSTACKEGRHAAWSDMMKGRTVTPGQTCAGYAGNVPCECTCHEVSGDGYTRGKR